MKCLPFVILLASAFSLWAVPVAAQDEASAKDGNGAGELPSRGELLAKSLIFSEEFTWITEPRTKEGLPDYPAAINQHFGQGISPEDNGAVALYEGFGPAPEGGRLSDRFFELLGIPVPADDGEYFRDFGMDLPIEGRQSAHEKFSNSCRYPWAAEDFPQLVKWLKDNEKPVAIIVDGTTRPHYFSPLVPPLNGDGNPGGLVATILPGIQRSRSVARYLTCRAMLNIEKGNVYHAWRDLMACHRLGEMIGRGPTLIEYLVGTAITSMATSGQIVFLDRVQPAAAQLAQYRQDLATLRPVTAAVEQIGITERMMYLDSVVQIACGRITFNDLEVVPPSGLEKFATQLAMLSIDWNIVMREGNSIYGRFEAAMKMHDYQQRRAAMLAIENELKEVQAGISAKGFLLAAVTEGSTRGAIGKMMGSVLSSLLLPALSAVDKAHHRALQTRENLLLAYALADWKVRHDSYPEKLDELVPDFVRTLPLDSFSEKPLIYRSEGDGFILYSVGVNHEDNEGRSYDDNPPGDDLVVRLPVSYPQQAD